MLRSKIALLRTKTKHCPSFPTESSVFIVDSMHQLPKISRQFNITCEAENPWLEISICNMLDFLLKIENTNDCRIERKYIFTFDTNRLQSTKRYNFDDTVHQFTFKQDCYVSIVIHF